MLQISLFVASVLGPATIFLMVSGALSLTLKIGSNLATFLTLIPILLFLIIALTTKQSTQVNTQIHKFICMSSYIIQTIINMHA